MGHATVPVTEANPEQVITSVQVTPVATFGDVVAAKKRTSPWKWRGGLFAGAYSIVGSYHPNNEDAYSHFPNPNNPYFCGVADGVGGGSHGDLASAAVLEHCIAAPSSTQKNSVALSQWVIDADDVVRKRVNSRGSNPSAATLVAVWFINTSTAHIIHVGDCRAYHLKPSQAGQWLNCITQDQTYTNLGQTPPIGGNGDDPARMVGVGASGTPPFFKQILTEGESLLLCSDGIHKFLAQEVIARIIGDGLNQGLAQATICHQLVIAAQAAGGYDDATALLVTRRYWFGIHRRWRIVGLLTILVAIGLQALVCWKIVQPFFTSSIFTC